MYRWLTLALVLVSISLSWPHAQTEVVIGDYTSPLRELTGSGNIGISNAVMRNQPEVRVLRVVVEPGGVRVIHAHDDVNFHLFVPISGPMMFDREGADSMEVPPWQPVYLDAGTRHGFRNTGTSPVDVMEVFVR